MSYRGPDDDYVEVNERIQQFRDKHPEGSLQSEIVDCPFEGFVTVKAYAYRTPDDPRPGVGLAWEPVPGQTPFTKDTELMNAETSAWGRALIAVGAADAKRGIASASEVRSSNGGDLASRAAAHASDTPRDDGGGSGPPQCIDCQQPIVGPVTKVDEGRYRHRDGCPDG